MNYDDLIELNKNQLLFLRGKRLEAQEAFDNLLADEHRIEGKIQQLFELKAADQKKTDNNKGGDK